MEMRDDDSRKFWGKGFKYFAPGFRTEEALVPNTCKDLKKVFRRSCTVVTKHITMNKIIDK